MKASMISPIIRKSPVIVAGIVALAKPQNKRTPINRPTAITAAISFELDLINPLLTANSPKFHTASIIKMAPNTIHASL